jgi:hypothetical protein
LFSDDVHLHICAYFHLYSQINIVFLEKEIYFNVLYSIFFHIFFKIIRKSHKSFLCMFSFTFSFSIKTVSIFLQDRTSSSMITWNNRMAFIFINLSFSIEERTRTYSTSVETHTFHYSFLVFSLSTFLFFLSTVIR